MEQSEPLRHARRLHPLCGAGMGGGGRLGFMWPGERTVFDAAICLLDESPTVRREVATADGTSSRRRSPITARTRDDACRELGTRIAGEFEVSGARSFER